eukprot:gene20007-biopygen13064
MPRPGGWCHQPPMPGLRQEMESHAAPQFRHSGGHAWGATLPAPAAPPSPMSGPTFMGGAAGPGHAVPSPTQYSAGAEILLPAYMTGATKDPPRASREELSSALTYASQAGIRYGDRRICSPGSSMWEMQEPALGVRSVPGLGCRARRRPPARAGTD